MNWRIVAPLVVAVTVCASGAAHAAPSGPHGLVVHLSRSGQVVVHLDATPIAPAFNAPPRTGVTAFVLEPLDMPSTPFNTRIGLAAHLRPGADVATVADSSGGAGLPAGRYLLSATIAGSGATVVIQVPGWTHDHVVTVQPTPGSGGATAVLPLADGLHTGPAANERLLTKRAVPRGYTTAVLTSIGSAGTAEVCLTTTHQCSALSANPVMPGSQIQTLSAAGHVPSVQAVARFTGAGQGPVWAAAAVIDAPLPH